MQHNKNTTKEEPFCSSKLQKFLEISTKSKIMTQLFEVNCLFCLCACLSIFLLKTQEKMFAFCFVLLYNLECIIVGGKYGLYFVCFVSFEKWFILVHVDLSTESFFATVK